MRCRLSSRGGYWIGNAPEKYSSCTSITINAVVIPASSHACSAPVSQVLGSPPARGGTRVEELFRYQQIRQSERLAGEQKLSLGLPLYPDDAVSPLASDLIDINTGRVAEPTADGRVAQYARQAKPIEDTSDLPSAIRGYMTGCNSRPGRSNPPTSRTLPPRSPTSTESTSTTPGRRSPTTCSSTSIAVDPASMAASTSSC